MPPPFAIPDRALQRAGDAPSVPGNSLTLLRDGPEVFSAWLSDIAAARRFILFENYIIKNDRIGNRVVDALIERARAGVAVYLLYDWFGCIATSRELWWRLRQAGVQVRGFNPAHFTHPLLALQRDHRKSVCIDGTIGCVGGVCLGDAWAGDPALHIPPWRDTAVRICGPAALLVGRAFAEMWALCGPPLPQDLLRPPPPESCPPEAAGAAVRVVPGQPGRSRIYRVTQVILPLATSKIWITDAYFLTPPALYEALLSAARDGVDVRVLVPGRSDLPWVSFLGRSGYKGLLSAGVRIFEWGGPMLHAKTAVVDGLWCRVGSSNLNLASLLTNWELDVLVEDPGFAATMEQVFLEDLSHSGELVLHRRRRRTRGRDVRPDGQPSAESQQLPEAQRARRATIRALPPEDPHPSGKRAIRRARRELGPSGGRAGAVVARAGAAMLGVALRRQFEQSAWSVASIMAIVLLSLGGLGLWRPGALGWPLSLLFLWLGVASLAEAVSQWRHRDRQRLPRPRRPRHRHRHGAEQVPGYWQQAKGSVASQCSPPPNHTEP